MTDFHNSDALLEENNRIERQRLDNERLAGEQRHARFMGVLKAVSRYLFGVSALLAVSIGGGPYMLQGCQYVSDNHVAAAKYQADVDARAHVAALAQRVEELKTTTAQKQREFDTVAAMVAERNRKRDEAVALRATAWEACIRTQGIAACEAIENRILLEVWGDRTSAERVGFAVDKILHDRGIVESDTFLTSARPDPACKRDVSSGSPRDRTPDPTRPDPNGME